MVRKIWPAVLVVTAFLLGVAYVFLQRPRESQLAEAPPLPSVGVHLFEGLGSYSHPIHSRNPQVQRWFDQGLTLSYGFNHDAAERAFLKAAELDPACAMCWWGAALVLGPHVNAAMDPAVAGKAWDRLGRARALAATASESERAYIEALAARYAKQAPADRRMLDEAYAKAMADLSRRYPDDLDAAVLHAEALMDLQPWNYWGPKGEPIAHAGEIVTVLEQVMARNPDHPGALHLYIHAVEASSSPDRGAAAADRLLKLVPASGHLVHMPAHIYARVGRYHDAMLANQKAIESDNAYLALCRPQMGIYSLGYVPHNHHFLWFAASFAGNSAIAIAAADETGKRANVPDLIAVPDYAVLQNFLMTPLFARVRFGHWQDVAAMPQPSRDLPYATALWHYGQGMAALRQNRLADAQANAEKLAAAAADPAIEALTVWNRYSLAGGLKVAQRSLEGELAAARGDFAAAIRSLSVAVEIEDGLPYDEPSPWHAPARQTLGAILLMAGQAAKAEAVFREDLRRNPENGWSLFGLRQALQAQARKSELDAITQRFEAAWQYSDVKLEAARF